ncbi:MAG TPA: hypothetical protein VLI69_00325 [Gammaproteobacteria bacterium]|nr:hypothetical protein [Gammaproteobacteria bacterium]
MTIIAKNDELGFSEIFTSEEGHLPPRKYRPKKKPYIVFKMSNVSEAMKNYLYGKGLIHLGELSEEIDPKTGSFTSLTLTVVGDRKVMTAIENVLNDPRYQNPGNQELLKQLRTFQAQCKARYDAKPKKSPPLMSKPYSNYQEVKDQKKTAATANEHYWVKTKSGKLKMFKKAGGGRSGGEIEDFNTECQRLLLGDRVPKVKPVHDPITGERIGHVIEKIEGLESIHDRLKNFLRLQDEFYEPTAANLLRDGVVLSEEEILQYELVKIWAARFIEGDSDPHGGNYGFGLKDGKKQAFSFDYDRAEFQVTSHFAGLNPKKAAPWQGYETAPKDMFPLTERDIINFPFLQDAKPMRGPTDQGRKIATLYLMHAPEGQRFRQSNNKVVYLYREKPEGKEEQFFYCYKGLKWPLDPKDVLPELKTASFNNRRCDDKQIYLPVLGIIRGRGHIPAPKIADADLIQVERVYKHQKFIDDKYYILLKRALIPDQVYITLANDTIRSSKKRELLIKAKIKKTKELRKVLLKNPEFHDYLKRNPEAIDQIESDFLKYNKDIYNYKDKYSHLQIQTNRIRENYNAFNRELTPGFFDKHPVVKNMLIGAVIGLAVVGIGALIYLTAGLAIPGIGSLAAGAGVTNASFAVALEVTSFVAGCALLLAAGKSAYAWMDKKIRSSKNAQIKVPPVVVPAPAEKVVNSHVGIKNTLTSAVNRSSLMSVAEKSDYESEAVDNHQAHVNKIVSFLQKNKAFFITVCEDPAVLDGLRKEYKDPASKDLLSILKTDPKNKSDLIAGILALKYGTDAPLKNAFNKFPRLCSALDGCMKARVVEGWNKVHFKQAAVPVVSARAVTVTRSGSFR